MLRLLVLVSAAFLAAADCASYDIAYTANCGAMDIYAANASVGRTQCSQWPSNPGCNTTDGTGCTSSNSWQCREYHANAASANPTVHCPHAAPNGGITTISNNPCQAAADNSKGTTSNGNCDDYCNWIGATCPTYYGLGALDTCRAACKNLNGATATDYSPSPPGSTYPLTGPTSGSTLACKRYHVELANTTATQAMHCPHATVGGGACGTDCETYCDLYLGTCSGDTTNTFGTNRTLCIDTCAVYRSDPSMFNATSGNSLQCRVYHAVIASTGAANANIHCPHASQFPTAACVDPAPTDCSSFCDQYAQSCPGNLMIYTNKNACMLECAKWPSDPACNPSGGAGCTNSNSWQCRAYHAMAAGFGFTGFNTTHCPHATPNGGITAISNNLCQEGENTAIGVTNNGNCDDYCNWVGSVCPTYYGLGDFDVCRAACKNMNGSTDTTYSPNPPTSMYPLAGPTTGASLACKRYHVEVANTSGDVVTHCPHATGGGGACGTDCETYCDIFMASCVGFSYSFTNRSTCLAVCAQYHTDPSKFNATTGNNLQCRLYHSVVASTGALVHCAHAGQFPTAYCVDTAPTDCDTFCDLYQASCPGSLNVYNSNKTDCLRECNFWPSDPMCDPIADSGCSNSNSWECRAYHAMLAGSGFDGYNTTHCPHASPVGAAPGANPSNNFCNTRTDAAFGIYNNGNCDDFCNVAVPTCGLTRPLCLSACHYINGSMDTQNSLASYPPTDPGQSNTLKCRRYHAYVASISPPAAAAIHCQHATTGKDVCGSNCDFYCDLMMGACIGTYTDRTSCLTSCIGFASNGGNYSAPEGNSLECRTYHAMVATSGANNSAIHCPHAQANPPSGTPCSSATTVAVGFMTVLLSILSVFVM